MLKNKKKQKTTCFEKAFYHFLNKVEFCYYGSYSTWPDYSYNCTFIHNYSQLFDSLLLLSLGSLRARIIYFADQLSPRDKHKAECLAQSRLKHLLK